VTVFSPDRDKVTTVAVGKVDGRVVIVSGDHGGTVRGWEADTGQPVFQPLRGHEAMITAVAVGMLKRGAVVVVGGKSLVEVLALASGEPVVQALSLFNGTRDPYSGLSSGISRFVEKVAVRERDGRNVIVFKSGRWTHVWDPDSGQTEAQLLRDENVWVLSESAGALDEREMTVSGRQDGTVRVQDASGQLKLSVRVDASIDAVAVAPGDRIVVGASKGLMILPLHPHGRRGL
jgi:WD40 repeat protein